MKDVSPIRLIIQIIGMYQGTEGKVALKMTKKTVPKLANPMSKLIEKDHQHGHYFTPPIPQFCPTVIVNRQTGSDDQVITANHAFFNNPPCQ